jgi:hypothetical protein
MNNSRYLMLMDFARLDYLARMGLMTAVPSGHHAPGRSIEELAETLPV